MAPLALRVQGDLADYLRSDDIIQSEDPGIRALADWLRGGADDVDFARAAFEWVRDEISHASDAGDPRVTLTASEVLQERVGLCYAKAHLLVALLRAGGIPSGLCYQRLARDEGGHVLHGLTAVRLQGSWHRLDPRGNKDGVDAQFSLDDEKLAYNVDGTRGEVDYTEVLTSAAAVVVDALRAARNVLTCPLPMALSVGR